MLKRKDIRIRDPFILTDFENKCYYMYGTTDIVDNSLDARNTFSVYKTYDLENFEEGKVVVDGGKLGLWGNRDYWAAEVHEYRGKYYLFGSMKANGKHRATQIFVCDTPDGEFKPVSQKAGTPETWECLDGTFYLYNGIPYMVFSHEWTEIHNGEICAIRLKDDLSETVGEPVVLFRGSDNPLVQNRSGNFVTDGPFLYDEDGKIKMIWSSFISGSGEYRILTAETNSLLDGKWTHSISKFSFDGGHAMLFIALDGKRYISLHAPNEPYGSERAVFFEY